MYVLPSCPTAKPFLLKSHLPKQSQADGRTTKVKVNSTKVRERIDLLVRERKWAKNVIIICVSKKRAMQQISEHAIHATTFCSQVRPTPSASHEWAHPTQRLEIASLSEVLNYASESFCPKVQRDRTRIATLNNFAQNLALLF